MVIYGLPVVHGRAELYGRNEEGKGLATLYIFGDESGTMPFDDNDKPFVAGTVALLEKKPAQVQKKLFEILRELNAVPFIAMVKPFPGYGKLVKAKYDKMETMARAKRLATGASAPEELNYRDVVWSHAMINAIGSAVSHFVLTASIDDVQILLDQKSMKPPGRALFTGMVINHMGVGITQILERIEHRDPGAISEWKNHVRFTDKTTRINWSDESDEFEGEFGLKLAHRLSQTVYRWQMNPAIDMGTMVRDTGFEDCVMDITKIITRLDQRIVDNFKRDTGLPEPCEL